MLLEPEEQDETEYLLSTEANRNHLLEVLRELDDSSSYIYVDPAKLWDVSLFWPAAFDDLSHGSPV